MYAFLNTNLFILTLVTFIDKIFFFTFNALFLVSTDCSDVLYSILQ